MNRWGHAVAKRLRLLIGRASGRTRMILSRVIDIFLYLSRMEQNPKPQGDDMERTVQDRVFSAIANSLGLENTGGIELSSALSDDLGADSLNATEIVMNLEREFSINIPDDIAEGITTVHDLIEVVTDRLPRRTEPAQPTA